MVQYQIILGGVIFSEDRYRSEYDKPFRKQRTTGSNRYNQGWIIYQQDNNGNITTSSGNSQKLTVKDMLNYLK